MTDSDGIEEAISGQIRVAITTAAQVGERFARERERALDVARRRSEREAAELRSRFDAERRAAQAQFANAHRTEWWDRANPQEVGDTYQLARAWSREDREAARAEQRISDELKSRYGVDVDALEPNTSALSAAVEQAEAARVATDAERRREAEQRAEAVILTQNADAADRAAQQAREAAEFEADPVERAEARQEAERHEARAMKLREQAEPQWDTADRRAATAHELEQKGLDSETIATRMRADVSQGQPATEATRSTPGRTVKARRPRGQGAGRQQAGLNR